MKLYILFQNTLLLYLLFFLCYLVLVPLQMFAVTRQRHPVTRLFTVSLLLEFVGLMFNVIDVIKYSMDGVGTPNLAAVGDILDILSRVRVTTLGSRDGHSGTTVPAHFMGYLGTNCDFCSAQGPQKGQGMLVAA